MRIVKQNRFKNLGELHKEWTEAGQGIKSHHTQTCQGIWLQLSSEASYLAKEKNWTGLLPSGPKSSFQMRVSFEFNLETKVLESGGRVEKLIAQVAWSPVLSFHSLMIWGAMSSAGFGPLCFFLKTNITAKRYCKLKKCWSTSCFLLLTSFLKMLISFSSRIWHLPTLPKAPKVGWMTMVLVCLWLASKLTRPEPHRESMGYCQEENEKTRDQKMQMSWRPLSKKPGLPYHVSSAKNWSPQYHAELR